MIAKHVGHLEERTGARLLNRTTRQVRPTDIGLAYYDRCVAVLGSIEEAESLAGADTAEPRGNLRITAPVEFGNAHLAPIVAEFMERNPRITLALDFSNRVVDIVQEGYDVAIRIARSLDTALVGRRLATSRFHVVASPRYLERHGRPATPDQLADHACLTFAMPVPWDVWEITRAGAAAKIKIDRAALFRPVRKLCVSPSRSAPESARCRLSCAART